MHNSGNEPKRLRSTVLPIRQLQNTGYGWRGTRTLSLTFGRPSARRDLVHSQCPSRFGNFDFFLVEVAAS